MALTVASNLVTISTCDVDDWDGGVGTLDTDFKKEGIGCLGIDTDIETNRVYKTIAQADWTGRHLYVWLMSLTAPLLDTKTNGGLQLILVDSAGNEGYWHVAGKDTYSGGWRRFVISADSVPDANDGSNPNKAQITKVGVGFKGIAKSKLAQNSFWDYVQYDTAASRGVKITGGVPDDWDEVLAKDEAACIGMIRKEGGVFYLQGTMQFGDTVAGDIDFADTNEILVFEDVAASPDFHKIIIVGNAVGTTNFKLGSKSGSSGIQGCVIKSAGNPKFQIIAEDVDIDALGLYGCTLLDSGTISLPTVSATRECLNCSFNNCSEILASTCRVQYCTIVNADDRGIKFPATHNVTDCSFINCGHCVHCNFSTPVTFDNLKFSGSDGVSKYDIEHSVAGTLTVNCNESNPVHVEETGGGSTDIENTVPLTVWVEDRDGVPVELAQVAIYDSTLTELMNKDTDAAGKAEITDYSYVGDEDIIIRIRKNSAGDTRYYPIATVGSITSTGFVMTAVLQEDLVVA